VREENNLRPFGRTTILKAYARNSRISDYERMLRYALEKGYTLCGLEESIELFANGHEKIIVLRHDVDQPSPGTRAMVEIEQRLGVKSTFYFRWRTVEASLIKDIVSAGGEASFHYETVSDLAAERGWQSREDLLKADGMKLARDRLLRDLRSFRAEFGVPCRTLAGHGHALNRICQTLNSETLWHGGFDRDRANFLTEAYDPDYLRELDAYVSDTVLEINGGFRYRDTLPDVIAIGSSRILFLTHPNHWCFSPIVRLRRLVKVIVWGSTFVGDVFSYRDWLRGGPRAGTDFARTDFWPPRGPAELNNAELT